MNEKQSNWADISLKIVIAAVVPVTVAIVGIFGQMILSDAAINQQILERIVRDAEAETAFRRDMFAELFTNFVDEISSTQTVGQLDALTTRLELLSGNFSDFLALRPLYVQLDRQIDRLLASQDYELQQYRERLRRAGRAYRDGQFARIDPYGVTWTLQIPMALLSSGATYNWPQDDLPGSDQSVELTPSELERMAHEISTHTIDGSPYRIEIRISNPDEHRQQVRCETLIYREDSEVPIHSSFTLDEFSFPLENNMIVSANHRLALGLGRFDSHKIEIKVLLFRHIMGKPTASELKAMHRSLEKW